MPSGNEGISIEESSNGGDVVTGLEVVHACFAVVDVAAVEQGVEVEQALGLGVDCGIVGAVGVTPCVVVVGYQNIALTVSDAGDVFLTVSDSGHHLIVVIPVGRGERLTTLYGSEGELPL